MSEMLEVILTVGLPASGKSTWAKKMVDTGRYKRVNKDDLRAMIDNSHWSESNEKFILSVRDFIVGESLKKGKSVIVDDTNFDNKHFLKMCEIVNLHNVDCIVREIYFPISISEAIERDSKREGKAKVGEDVIKKMYGSYVKNQIINERSQIFRKIKTSVLPKRVMNLPEAIICDLDGTLAIIHNRSPYDASRCEEDLINKPVADILLGAYEKGKKIIFVSGREDKYREQTEKFIKNHLVTITNPVHANVIGDQEQRWTPIEYELFMRKTNDGRKDYIVKREIYDEFIKDKYDVQYVLDDRPSVIRMWRYDLGLTVFALNDKEF